VKFDVLLHWTIKFVIVFEFVWVKRNCVRLFTKLSSWQLATFFFRPVIWVVIYLSCLWNLIRDILRSIEKWCNTHLLFQDLFLTEKHYNYITILGLRKKKLSGVKKYLIFSAISWKRILALKKLAVGHFIISFVSTWFGLGPFRSFFHSFLVNQRHS
jgi:hypothetical protein